MGKSKKGETVEQHYVPQFYIRNFYNSKNKVDCWYIESNCIRSKSSSTICYEDYLYESIDILEMNEIENILGLIENEISESIKHIFITLKNCKPSIEFCYRTPMGKLKEDIEKLVMYIVIQMIRTPYIVKEYPFIIDRLLELNKESKDIFYQSEEVKTTSKEDINKVLRAKGFELFFKDKRIIAYMYSILMQTHNIVFFKSDKLHFLSSDEPIIISFNGNINELDTQKSEVFLQKSDLFFSLNPHYCIGLIRKGEWFEEDIPEGQFGIINVNYRIYEYITKLLVRNSHKYIFTDELNDVALNLIKKVYVT